MKTGIQLTLTSIFISGLLLFSGIVLPVAGQPVLSNIETSDLAYTAGDPAIQVTKTIRVSGRNLLYATIAIGGDYIRGSDILIYKGTGSLSFAWDEVNGILTLTGNVSENTYRDALRNVYFESSSGAAAGTRVITFVIYNKGLFGNIQASKPVKRNINVEASNKAPVLGNVSTDPVIYCMDSDGEIITETITITDIDNTDMASALVEITLGYSVNDDVLLYSDMNGITGSWNSTAGQLTLSGVSSLANYQEALRSIRFQNKNSENPHAGLHEITFSVYDGKVWSNKITRGITHPMPTASIAGDFTICRDEHALLQVTFTGSAPWSFSYTTIPGEEISFQNISVNPYSLPVSNPGTYTLTSVSDRLCPGKTSGSGVVSLRPEPDVTITGLKSAYSRESTEMILLTAEPSGGVFSGQGVIPYGSGWYFLPSLPPPGITHIVYKYRPDESYCFGYDTATVRILEKSAAIESEHNRTKFCLNDRPFKVTGINLLNNSYGTFSISGGRGLTDHGNNTATIYPDSLTVNEYIVSYTPPDGYTTTLEIEIGSPLAADFKWDKECFEPGSPVNFLNTSSSPFGFLTSNSYRWKVRVEQDSAMFTTEDIEYVFPETGNYEVRLHITNSNGCENEISKVFPLRPVYALAGFNYSDDFENKQDWESGYSASAQNNSWVLGKPGVPLNGFAEPYSGENCWYTNIEVNPAPRENSWITSPCFDFSGTEKPTLVAKIQRSFTDTRDGANISYTVDNGAHWNLLGGLNDGINWFNAYFGNPGSQSQGWTAIKDDDWVESRHILDFLKGEQMVQFRVNFITSGSAIGNKGLAVDDIEIVERNRTILVEHFTNISTNSFDADEILGNVAMNAGSGLIDLHYHSSDPNDPFYGFDPVLSDTRQFYYGLNQVPWSVINGGTNEARQIDYVNRMITSSQVGIESLYDSDFNIKVTSMPDGDRLYIETLITALEQVPLSELSLRIVVFEPVVIDSSITGEKSSFRNVVRAMIPDAAGRSFYAQWENGQTYRIVEHWEIGNVFNKQGLRVAAFLQNEMNHEIEQAALDETGLINATGDPTEMSVFSLYPNPANDILHITAEGYANDYRIELVSLTGITVLDKILRGEQTISMNNLHDGMYLCKITTHNGRTEIHKISVRH